MPYTYGMQNNRGLPPRVVQRAVGISPDFPVVGNGLGGLPVRVTGPTPPTPSQQAYTTAGTFSWVAPANVTSVCVVAVGGGGNQNSSSAGRGGGGLGYKNNIAVTPATSYTVVVGNSQATSYFINTGTVYGGGASSQAGGLFGGDGGGNGGAGNAGGGGAGGYSGNGGAGSITPATGSAGSGGGGGGGGGYDPKRLGCGGGGGVGILGQGASGNGAGQANGGVGGSGGGSGSPSTTFGGAGQDAGGGLYGGGAGGYAQSNAGGRGAVRIIWGLGRAFPSTNTGDL